MCACVNISINTATSVKEGSPTAALDSDDNTNNKLDHEDRDSDGEL